MTKLHQLIAIEKTVAKTAEDAFTKTYQGAQKTDLFAGLIKTYQSLEDGGYEFPGESKKVLLTGEGLLSSAQSALEPLFDHVVTKDSANQEARANIEVDGTVVARDVPVSTLLWIEKRLIAVRDFVSKIPTLDPAENWVQNESDGIWRSDPYRTVRQVKVKRFVSIAKATEKHAEQVAQVDDDKIEGTWTTVKLSGAVPAFRKQQLLNRVDTLTKAVKSARELANSIQVTDVSIGNSVLNYLFSH